MEAEDVDKTIVMSFDDVNRMIDLCKDKEGVLLKDFFDWYLFSEDYFTRSGMLILELNGRDNKPVKMAASFNLHDADNVEIVWYSYKHQYPICAVVMHRQDNLTMNDVTFEEKYVSVNMFKKDGLLIYGDNKHMLELDELLKKDEKLANSIRRLKGAERKRYDSHLRENSVEKFIHKIIMGNMRMITYSLYSLMYYASRKKMIEVIPAYNKSLDEGEEKTVGVYKYTGYVDLRKNKTYKPVIKKDPNEPVRDYRRHIGSWTVIGHYRNIKGKKVWIDEQIRGDGELEKRVYGTLDADKVGIIPKVFEVERVDKSGNNSKSRAVNESHESVDVLDEPVLQEQPASDALIINTPAEIEIEIPVVVPKVIEPVVESSLAHVEVQVPVIEPAVVRVGVLRRFINLLNKWFAKKISK